MSVYTHKLFESVDLNTAYIFILGRLTSLGRVKNIHRGEVEITGTCKYG